MYSVLGADEDGHEEIIFPDRGLLTFHAAADLVKERFQSAIDAGDAAKSLRLAMVDPGRCELNETNFKYLFVVWAEEKFLEVIEEGGCIGGEGRCSS